ncbi:MAG: hypothetical protein QOI58_3141 [Thermoanaerobaculia bacterium]|jgi:hypothetical protein|nr:hypothetical protein [Thermoanaerobaculia bacterium]
MTKSQIKLLMARDVDDISDAAVHHPAKTLRVTLKNAAALLARAEMNNDIKEYLFIFKLLRFVQAALAGMRARVTADVAQDLIASTQLVLKRNQTSDLNRAARDVLSLLMVKTSARDIIKNGDLSVPELLALYGKPSLGPRRYEKFRALKSTLARHAEAAKSGTTRSKASAAPKRLLPR